MQEVDQTKIVLCRHKKMDPQNEYIEYAQNKYALSIQWYAKQCMPTNNVPAPKDADPQFLAHLQSLLTTCEVLQSTMWLVCLQVSFQLFFS